MERVSPVPSSGTSFISMPADRMIGVSVIWLTETNLIPNRPICGRDKPVTLVYEADLSGNIQQGRMTILQAAA
ncbi:MAG: hypothetical protein AAAC47_24135 [Pararhizobium sp.]